MTLERKYEALIKDVRKYEGELADYNLALDKYRSGRGALATNKITGSTNELTKMRKLIVGSKEPQTVLAVVPALDAKIAVLKEVAGAAGGSDVNDRQRKAERALATAIDKAESQRQLILTGRHGGSGSGKVKKNQFILFSDGLEGAARHYVERYTYHVERYKKSGDVSAKFYPSPEYWGGVYKNEPLVTLVNGMDEAAVEMKRQLTAITQQRTRIESFALKVQQEAGDGGVDATTLDTTRTLLAKSETRMKDLEEMLRTTSSELVSLVNKALKADSER